MKLKKYCKYDDIENVLLDNVWHITTCLYKVHVRNKVIT